MNQAAVIAASWFTAADIFVAGIALDLIGATLIAWPIVSRSTREIANLYQLGGFNMATLSGGNIAAAARAARETAMSRVGAVCLLLGFAIQGAGYFAEVTRGLEGRDEAFGAAVIVVAEVGVAAVATWLLVRWLAPRILAAAQSTGGAAPPATPPAQRAAVWTETEELQRLDGLAGVLLQTALAAMIAGVTLAATLEVSQGIEWLLLGGAVAAGVAAIASFFALYWSPLGAVLGTVVATKQSRTRIALWLLTVTVEVVGGIGLVSVLVE